MVTVAGLTGVSRLAGFVRDILTASILGAGPVADAFFVALKLPNFFRRVTAEGAFSVSFVPLYTETLEKEGQDEANIFALNAFSIMLYGLGVICILAVAAMPLVINLVAPGFSDDPVRYDLAIELSRITFPYLLLMSLTALLGGVLNAHNRFGPFAFAPVLFNLCLIAALLANKMFETPGHALAWGVLIAGFAQLRWLLFCAKRSGFRLKLQKPKLTVRIKKVFKLMGPGVIGAGVMHINLFADLIIASFLDTGSISSLYYADRLNQLPLGVVGIAVGTALLPMLSRAVAAQEVAEARDLFNRALEYCLLLALPAATALFIISWPIIVTLFHHGAFTWQAAWNTTAVLTAYCLGLPAYIAVKVFATTFWSRQDTKTPVIIAVAATLFNIALSLWLVFVADKGVVGIALATALSGWLQIALYFWFLRGRVEARLDARLMRNALKIAGSCGVMALGLVLIKGQVFGYFHPEADYGVVTQGAALAVLVTGGVLVYGVAVFASGVLNPRQLKKYMTRKQ